MLQLMRKKAAFTLIELLVVVIIVAVLAAVGIPLLSANVQRARASEAEASLGTIRTGLRSYFAELGTYVGAALPTTSATASNVGLSGDDLTGRFFEFNDFTLTNLGVSTYCIGVDGDTGGLEGVAVDTDPNNNATPDPIIRSMNQTGQIFSGNTTCT